MTRCESTHKRREQNQTTPSLDVDRPDCLHRVRRPHLCRGDDVRSDTAGRYQDQRGWISIGLPRSRLRREPVRGRLDFPRAGKSRNPGAVHRDRRREGHILPDRGRRYRDEPEDRACRQRFPRGLLYQHRDLGRRRGLRRACRPDPPDLLGRGRPELSRGHRGRDEPARRLAGLPNIRIDRLGHLRPARLADRRIPRSRLPHRPCAGRPVAPHRQLQR